MIGCRPFSSSVPSMEYTMKHDSSGTEDDLPNHDIFRTSRGVLPASMMTTSRPVSRETDLQMKFQIHCMEMEAYGAVLRAFNAQSDSLSWGKEALITELRKELRLSDDEHRQILGTINSDESFKAIREWRTGIDDKKLTATNPAGFDLKSGGRVSRKKLKSEHNVALSTPKYPSSAQPSPAAFSCAIAVPVRDDQRASNAALCTSQMNVGKAMVLVPQKRQAPSSGKAQESWVVQTSVKGFSHSGLENLRPGSDIIRIRATDRIIHEVEKLFGGENPAPAQVEKARLLLRDHERALLEAIAKLADARGGDESPEQNQHLYPSKEPHRNAHRIHNTGYRKLDRLSSYYSEGYAKDHAERAGVTFIDLPDD